MFSLFGSGVALVAFRSHRTGIYVGSEGEVRILTLFRTIDIPSDRCPVVTVDSIFGLGGLYPRIEWGGHTKTLFRMSQSQLLVSKKRFLSEVEKLNADLTLRRGDRYRASD